MRITAKMLVRSALVGLFLTIEGIGLQVLKSRLVFHNPPPEPGHLAGVIVCYLLAGFGFALGFFLFRDRLPGGTWIGKGLRYAAVVLLAVWISGFFVFNAIDFEGGWDLFSPVKVEALWIALCDCVNFIIGGVVLGLIARKDGPAAPAAAPFTANLAARVAAGALLLPVLCTPVYFLAEHVIPGGLDLSGDRINVFYFFVFVPLVIAGGGTALLHDALRSGPPRGVIALSWRISLAVFILYWVPNVLFVPFFGFTWAMTIDFLFAMAVALFVTIVTLEVMTRVGSRLGGALSVPEFDEKTVEQ